MGTWDEVIDQLDGKPSPAPHAEPAPSPDRERAPDPAAARRAERAAAAADTGAETDTATQPVGDPPAPAEATEPAARTTYPKWWKGTEAEWQEARAEGNRAANRERDRAEKAERALAELTERQAYMEAQLGVRDGTFAEIVAQATGDPSRADTLLAADRQRGTDAYIAAKRQRDAEAERAQAEAARAEAAATTAAQNDEAARKQLYADNLVLANEYADGKGVVGLKASDVLMAEFAKPENKYLLDLSQDDTASARAAQAATNEIYGRAHAAWRTLVDDAATAKAAAVRGDDPTAAGRRTAVGTQRGASAEPDEWTPAAADRDLANFYAEQDRRAGGHTRLDRAARQAATRQEAAT